MHISRDRWPYLINQSISQSTKNYLFLNVINHLDEPQPFLSNGFENGFRYFLHANDEISYLSHEGISVSPGSNVDSSVGPTKVDNK